MPGERHEGTSLDVVRADYLTRIAPLTDCFPQTEMYDGSAVILKPGVIIDIGKLQSLNFCGYVVMEPGGLAMHPIHDVHDNVSGRIVQYPGVGEAREVTPDDYEYYLQNVDAVVSGLENRA